MIASGTVDTTRGRWKWQVDIGHEAKLIWAVEAPDGSKRAGIFDWNVTAHEARERIELWICQRARDN